MQVITMINHTVVWKFKENALGNDKITNMNLLKEKLLDLVDKIDEIIDLKVGFNCKETPSSYDFILNVLFKNMEDLNAYIINEDHKKVGAFVREVIETRVSIDYEV